MLKVLMLGWEFPPHISGGLGIACHGLTAALVKDHDLHVNLVLPVVHGDESSAGITLISANDSARSITNKKGEDPKPAIEKSSKDRPKKLQGSKLVITKIQADLDPYRLAMETGEKTVPWNRQLPTAQSTATKSSGAWNAHTRRAVELKGGYGPTLFDEVGRYADVVADLSTSLSFDVIHAHDWMTFPAGWGTSERTGKPLIVHFHATEFDRAGDTGSSIVYDIEREAVLRSKKIITVSKYTADLLTSRYGADVSKIKVVHNGIATPARGAQKETTRDRHIVGDKVVSFLGRVTYQKGPLYFVNAAEKVLQQIPDCHFVMAGSGDTLPQVIKEVARRGMSRNFHFTGFLGSKEIEKVLSISSVYVMPSVSEPFGITPLEAIRAGVPVIISKQSGVSEVMPHAIKVDFWDTDAMSQAICGVLQHRSLATTLITGAREQITSITWEAAATKVKALYHETVTQ